MPHLTAADGIKLYYEDTGDGTPILFIHEFAGDWRSWEPQVSHFSRRRRCIVYSARGYPGSETPENEASYSQDIAREDALAVLDHLGIEKAHIVGLSMGGFATLHFGMVYPHRALSLTICGCGYGSEPNTHEEFQSLSLTVADNFERRGAADFAEEYVTVPGRLTFKQKDPRGWDNFVAKLREHSNTGAALTQRGVQASRPSLWDLEEEIRSIPVPSMIVTGDDDERCLVPGIFMKKLIAGSRLFVIPNTGHVLNLEEPELFNNVLGEFFADVEVGN
ncbi:MAG: alpha/beta hydrolase [Pelagibacteraceae bacterium]|nr:alpha/beta hydrolase [Pelagibacteraceae bacterium]PPR10878.1 MAG: 3-oxoadipate enol-lactonase 2 [Alphaproteobacteria bacterium MarineAlpha11_Bin1]|tara:strand:+ start:16557 stop:17387 length:831 start_codon:yes stop_codon:yes gene_type:complete